MPRKTLTGLILAATTASALLSGCTQADEPSPTDSSQTFELVGYGKAYLAAVLGDETGESIRPLVVYPTPEALSEANEDLDNYIDGEDLPSECLDQEHDLFIGGGVSEASKVEVVGSLGNQIVMFDRADGSSSTGRQVIFFGSSFRFSLLPSDRCDEALQK